VRFLARNGTVHYFGLIVAVERPCKAKMRPPETASLLLLN
jgi:hypothetical protein